MEIQNGSKQNDATIVIKNLLRDEGKTEILSAKIGKALLDNRIDYRFGGIKLKAYLQNQVAGLKLIRKIGLDEFWGFTDSMDLVPPNFPVGVADNPWKVLASPKSTQTVVWIETASSWLVLPSGLVPAEDQYKVGPITSDELLNITNAFAVMHAAQLANFPDLFEKIRNNHEDWFQRFKNQLPEMVGTWNTFRINEITKTLLEHLKQAFIAGNSISEPSFEVAASALHKMRLQLTQNRVTEARAARPSPAQVVEMPQDTTAIKNLAVKAVSRMSDSEIRKIWLPLGSVFDAVS